MENYINKPLTVIKEEVTYLFKADLRKSPKLYNFNDVNLRSFRNTSITSDDINKASLIIYICYENYARYKILKSKLF